MLIIDTGNDTSSDTAGFSWLSLPGRLPGNVWVSFQGRKKKICVHRMMHTLYIESLLHHPVPAHLPTIRTFQPQLKYWLINRTPSRSTKLSQSYRVQGSLIHDLSKISTATELELHRRVGRGGLWGPSCRCAVLCAPGFGWGSSLGSCFCAEKCFSQTSAAIMWFALANDGG